MYTENSPSFTFVWRIFCKANMCLPEATFSSEVEADRTLHGFGSQDSLQSDYFSTILSPPQVDQIPTAQPEPLLTW